MATITNRSLVEEIIRNDGHYEDDPRVVKIVEYRNAFDGREAFGLIYEDESLDRYDSSPFIREPKTIFPVPVKTSEENPPSLEQVLDWFEMDSTVQATDGCEVEPDGICPHGKPSWFLKLGLL